MPERLETWRCRYCSRTYFSEKLAKACGGLRPALRLQVGYASQGHRVVRALVRPMGVRGARVHVQFVKVVGPSYSSDPRGYCWMKAKTFLARHQPTA